MRLFSPNHVAVDQIGVSALRLGDGVEVFQRADVVGAHPAVLPGDGVALHAALVVAAHQAVDVELHIKAPLFVFRNQGAVDRLLDAHQPWADGVDGEGDVLALDVGKRRPFQIADHVRRHAEDAADLRHLELAGFKELRLVVGHGQRCKRHVE